MQESQYHREWHKLIKPVFYHGANHSIWKNGGIPLGKFISGDNTLDLGVTVNKHPHHHDDEYIGVSFTIVYGTGDDDYLSSCFLAYAFAESNFDYFDETIQRYNKYLRKTRKKKK